MNNNMTDIQLDSPISNSDNDNDNIDEDELAF